MSVEYRILGPVEVDLDDGRPAPVPRGRARGLLCLLLVYRREAVTADQIVDALWADAPPANARNAVQVVVSRLRAAIGVDAVGSTAAGYTLAVDPAAVDADRFEALARRGRDEAADGRAREAAATLRAALELWRGPPLADVAGAAFAQPEVARLEALRLQCTADRIAADFATGAEVAGELEALVAEHPLDERLRELLMRALYRAGRQADALAVYRDARTALLGGLGLEPGPALRELEAEILRHEVESPRPATPVLDDRRQVTCVFAGLDIAHASPELDPEAIQRAVAGYHAAVMAVCGRHGGTVCDLRADGALLAFGVPVAREDDPLRAVRAALELVADGGVRAVGISTGVVVASTGAGDAEVFGRPVTEAEALARGRSGVHAAASTWRLVDHAGDGEREPDGSVRVERLSDDAPAIRRQLDRPLVGRRDELDVVFQAHAQAGAEQAWVVVTVAGEPGIGKSRLAAELPAALPDGTVVVTGRCPPYGEGTTFRPLRDIVLQACGGRPLGELPEALDVPSEIVERVAALAGLGPGPAGDEAPWAVRRFLGALARDAPVTVVVDDVQWAEPGLLDLLESVVATSGSGPGLLVCLTRPGGGEAWAAAASRHVHLDLGPLSPSESRALLDQLGGTDAARERIAEAAAGNPLFLEQLATYVDERLDDGDLPPAIHAVLAARLDSLEPGERAALCYGSIQGDEFGVGSILALADGASLPEIEVACAALVRRGLLTEDDALRFRHSLIRDTAYASLSKAARARLHERHATWLAGRSDAGPDIEAQVGSQLEAAWRCARDIGAEGADDLAVRARAALAAAARAAHRRGDLRGEIGLLERAARFDQQPPEERAELLPALAAALFAAGSFERAAAVAEEGVRAGRAAGAPRASARAVVERERLRVYQGQATTDTARSLQIVDRALDTLSALGDDLGVARAHYLRCELVWMGGDPEAGHASAERMLEAARRAGSGFEASAAVGFMAWALVQGVTPVAAALERCDELAGRFAGDRVAQLEVAGFRAVLEAMAGGFDAARAGMASSREGLAELGLRQACAYMALFDAQLETLAGDGAAAERAVRDAERITAETGDRWFQATVRVDLAHALLRQGAWRDAAAAVAEIDALPAPSDAEWVVKRLSARALLAAHRGALDEALDDARAAAAAADVTKLLTFRADAHRTLAEVLALAGDGPAAEAAGREALRLYEAKGNAAAAARPISVG